MYSLVRFGIITVYPEDMSWFLFMVFAAFIVFLVLLAAACIPYTCMRTCCTSLSSTVHSLIGCASCGVFIGTCFLGLIPHVRHQEMFLRSNTTASATGTNFPSADSLVVIGFLIILVSEQLITAIGHTVSTKRSIVSPKHTMNMRKLLEEDSDDNEPLVDVAGETEDDNEDIIFRHHSSPSRCASDKRTVAGSPLHIWFLLLGMSVHSFFEGVALGVQRDYNSFTQVLLAILLHEILCCVSYGVQLAKHNAPKMYAWCSIGFLSATIPFGMIASLTIDGVQNETWQKLARYWLEGLAAGTFVHVALVELLPMEMNGGDGHGHSHNIMGDVEDQDEGHTHGHAHGQEKSSPWTGVVKTAFVTSGILLFVFVKSFFNH